MTVTMGIRTLTHGFVGGGTQFSPQQMEQMELGLLDRCAQKIIIFFIIIKLRSLLHTIYNN